MFGPGPWTRNDGFDAAVICVPADKAVLDLKPFANDARTKIAQALTEFQQVSDGVRVDTSVNGLRLTGIEFDAKTLRVIAEADGSVKVAVSKLPGA